MIRRDLGPAGASFRIGGAESVITTRALRVTIRHAPFRVAFRRGGRVAPPLLLWFHRLPWDHKLKSGRTLWDELVLHYARGAKEAASLEDRWKKLEGRVDRDRHQAVAAKLRRQVEDAAAWRDKCVRYFQGFSKRPVPVDDPR